LSLPCPASLIIPVLNEQAIIVDQLKQLQALRNADFEIIVVDGGSEDDTRQLATPLADKVLVTEKGRAGQMNYGAAFARGEFLVFLHLDSTLPPDMVERVDRWQLTAVAWGFFPVRLSGAHPAFRVIERAICLRSRYSHVATGDQVIFLRRQFFSAQGGFAAIPLMEDVELCKRLRRVIRPEIERQPVITSSRRWQENGIMPTVVLMWRLRLGYFLGESPDRLIQRYYR